MFLNGYVSLFYIGLESMSWDGRLSICLFCLRVLEFTFNRRKDLVQKVVGLVFPNVYISGRQMA